MRLYLAAVSLLGLVLVPFTASALGLGEIALDSALNQPFSAEILIESGDNTELSELKVSLASPDTFKRYGLERPAYLNSFTFNVAKNAAGEPIISLRSREPISEPFVTLLLDVRWSSGRLLREYTVLLDPPLYENTVVQPAIAPAQTAAKVVSPTAGSVQRSAEPAYVEEDVVESTGLFQQPIADEPAVASGQANEPLATPAVAPGSSASVVSKPAASNVPQGSYRAARGDTLWGIAERSRASVGLSNNQMMLALYRANPQAFMGNINQLKAGSILRIPGAGEVDAPSVSEANAEVKQQHAVWSGDAVAQPDSSVRLQLIAPTDSTSSQAAVADSVDSGTASGREAQQRIGQLEQELNESKRLLQIRDAELQSLQQRVNALQQEAGEVADLTTDESVGVALDEQPLLDVNAQSDGMAAEQIFADEAVDEAALQTIETAVAPVQAPAASVVETASAQESSFLGELFSSMWLWISAAVVLLLAVLLARRRKAPVEDAEATGSWANAIDETGHQATIQDFGDELEALDDEESLQDSFAPLGDDSDDGVAIEIGDADDFEQDAIGQDEVELPLEKTISTGAPLNLDQADPIAEAEFHMAYGLYDQAADLLVKALQEEADNRAYRVKLLEVYFVWENKKGFMEQARLLQEAIGGGADSDWNKVLILGKQLCPDERLFSGSAGDVPLSDSMDLELSEGSETEVDFSLGGADSESDGMGRPASDGLDFDFGDDDLSAEDDDGLTLNLGNEDAVTLDSQSSADTVALDSDFDFDFGGELDADAATMESPTIDAMGEGAPTVDIDFGEFTDGETMESPTIESPLFNADEEDSNLAETMETPTVENPMYEPTVESPTLDAFDATAETSAMPALQGFDDADDDEIDLSNLDVDLSGLADLPIDDDDVLNVATLQMDTKDAANLFADDEELAEDAADEDASDNGPVFRGDATYVQPETENIRLGSEDETVLTSLKDFGKIAGDTDGDADVDSDELGNDTVEQPLFDAGTGDDDTAEQPSFAEAQTPDDATMTEVGTKLDLARAYIDMGDPDGARSILNEVLEEGAAAQKQEARQLLDELSD